MSQSGAEAPEEWNSPHILVSRYSSGLENLSLVLGIVLSLLYSALDLLPTVLQRTNRSIDTEILYPVSIEFVLGGAIGISFEQWLQNGKLQLC